MLGSLAFAILIAHPPFLRESLWIAPFALASLWGMVETARCVRRRWSFYHAGVMLCLVMDLLAVTMTWFFLLYPYFAGWSRL